MTSSKDVEVTSRSFFKKHWSPDGGEIPAWSAPFKIEGNSFTCRLLMPLQQ